MTAKEIILTVFWAIYGFGGWFFCLVINNNWAKICEEMNDDWSDLCKKIIAELTEENT